MLPNFDSTFLESFPYFMFWPLHLSLKFYLIFLNFPLCFSFYFLRPSLKLKFSFTTDPIFNIYHFVLIVFILFDLINTLTKPTCKQSRKHKLIYCIVSSVLKNFFVLHLYFFINLIVFPKYFWVSSLVLSLCVCFLLFWLFFISIIHLISDY